MICGVSRNIISYLMKAFFVIFGDCFCLPKTVSLLTLYICLVVDIGDGVTVVRDNSTHDHDAIGTR